MVAPVEGEFLQFDMMMGGEFGPEPGVLPEGDVSTEKQKYKCEMYNEIFK